MSLLFKKNETAESGDAYALAWNPGVSVATPKDPRTKSKFNVISRLFFSWATPIFFIGFKRSLDHSDLYAYPSEADSRLLLNNFNRHWSDELKRRKQGLSVRLWMVLIKIFYWRFLIQGLLTISYVFLAILQSVLVGKLAGYFSMEENITEIQTHNMSSDHMTEKDTAAHNAYIYATGLSLITLLLVLVNGHYAFTGFKLGFLARIMLTSATFQKMLTLSQTVVGQLTIGNVVNLASNDVHRFDRAFIHNQYIWAMPVHLIVVTGLLCQQSGYSALFLCGIVLLQIPLQMFLAKLFRNYKLKAAQYTDHRVKVMNEVINGIRLIKMYAWENAFKRTVTKIRQ